MLILLVFGVRVERRLGRARFAMVYLVCGYTAAYGFAFSEPDSIAPLIGASGAIAGVCAGYVWLYPRDWLLRAVAILFVIPLPVPRCVRLLCTNSDVSAETGGLISNSGAGQTWPPSPVVRTPVEERS